MRDDFDKLFTEAGKGGPRRTHREVRGSKRRKFRRTTDPDQFEGRTTESMRRPYTTLGVGRYSVRNINPLLRYLHKQVGRKWDDVFSDISANVKKRGRWNDLDSYLESYVTLFGAWRIENGEFQTRTWDGSFRTVYRGPRWYVDAEGFLREANVAKRSRYNWRKPKDTPPTIEVDKYHKFVFDETVNLWFYHEFRPAEKPWQETYEYTRNNGDTEIRTRWHGDWGAGRNRYWGGEPLAEGEPVFVRRQQASKKQIRQHGLYALAVNENKLPPKRV